MNVNDERRAAEAAYLARAYANRHDEEQPPHKHASPDADLDFALMLAYPIGYLLFCYVVNVVAWLISKI